MGHVRAHPRGQRSVCLSIKWAECSVPRSHCDDERLLFPQPCGWGGWLFWAPAMPSASPTRMLTVCHWRAGVGAQVSYIRGWHGLQGREEAKRECVGVGGFAGWSGRLLLRMTLEKE